MAMSMHFSGEIITHRQKKAQMLVCLGIYSSSKYAQRTSQRLREMFIVLLLIQYLNFLDEAPQRTHFLY